jgi:hypothetical protein
MQGSTQANDVESDQTDVAVETEIEADRVEARVSCDVKPRNWPGKDFDVIVLTWDHDAVNGVNSFSKASIINDVYQSNAAVELHDSCDGDEAVVFKVAE